MVVLLFLMSCLVLLMVKAKKSIVSGTALPRMPG